ncbi:MAG: 4Fe-4S ferredoxin [Geobacter sp.]|nr:MAG: 4Fe-4S ferredoxin [Geobacter sp.]
MKEWRGIPRQEIPWFPTIDPEKCTGCKTCMEFCKNDVLTFDGEAEKVLVANPFNCVVECRTCSRLCPSGAISFPAEKDFAAWLQEYRGKS